ATTGAVLQIALDGSNSGIGASGLVITAGHSTVRGLAVNRFAEEEIELRGNGGNVIEGNSLSTVHPPDGPFACDGVEIESGSSNNLVGGTTPAARNVIGTPFLSTAGVVIRAAGNRVQG